SGLELARAPAGPHRRGTQRTEEHRLAHAPQAGQHDRAFGTSARDALEDDVEGVELLVPARELGRSLAGAGSIRVANGVHDRRLYASLVTTAYIGIGG